VYLASNTGRVVGLCVRRNVTGSSGAVVGILCDRDGTL
jgi:hypothetical protein